MISVIKDQIETLRTNVKDVIPKFFKFWKFILIGILSGLIWVLYFIGAATDIIHSFLVMIKKQLKEKQNEGK
jgi:hypothetical protein|tara:strand:- start:1946 stop:2161 length:216 start_codon:yes stop_codon:yes gene_type:complete